jgi:hypothetical protein
LLLLLLLGSLLNNRSRLRVAILIAPLSSSTRWRLLLRLLLVVEFR